MRHFLLCLFLALTTFALGMVPTVFLKDNKIERDVLRSGIVGTPKPPESTLQTELTREDLNEDRICSGLSMSDYQEPAIEKWLKGERFTGKLMRPPVEYRSEGDEFIPSLLDVNGDGKMELKVKSYCSTVGNCWFNIYQRIGRSYREIFFTHATGQTVDLLKSSHKGFRDIEIVTKKDDSDRFISQYFFTDSAYEPKECFEYQKTADGKKILAPLECYLVNDDQK